MRFALQRMHRLRGRRQAQVQGLTWPMRNRLQEAVGDRLIDVRNRALLAVAYDTLLRRSELVSLEVSDLLVDIDGSATLLVRSGKTDPDRRGAMLYLAPRHRQAGPEMAGGRRHRRGAPVPFGPERRGGAGETRPEPSAAHLQGDGAAGRASRRHRRRPSRAQHPRRTGSGYDRLRHRAAGHPAVRPVEDDADGPTLRGAVAGAAQRRGAVGRAAAALKVALRLSQTGDHVSTQGPGMQVGVPLHGGAPPLLP